jgi:hypothetical protein
MEEGWSFKTDDVIIVGIVVMLGALTAWGLQRALKWHSYPYWIVLTALVAGILINNWLAHAVQPRF